MDDMNTIAHRMRLSANAERLRENLAREQRNVVKLTVSQDTAYWDLKEQLRQLQSNHEKLQANMIEVQMQYEAVSGQYQEELRRRPETLNKLNSNRQICNVLENYCERLRDTLSRSRADLPALYEAYQQSEHVAREFKARQMQVDKEHQLLVEGLQEKLKLTSSHNSQLQHYFSVEKQRTDSELVQARSKLEATLVRNAELTAAGNDLTRQMDKQTLVLNAKQETVTNLEKDMNKMVHDFNSQRSEMKNAFLQQEKVLKEASAVNESLKEALTHQETYTKTVCDEKNELQEEIAARVEELQAAKSAVGELKKLVESSTTTINNMKAEIADLTKKKESLEKQIEENNQLLTNSEAELQQLKRQLSALEAENDIIANELKASKDQVTGLTAENQNLVTRNQVLNAKVEDIEANLYKIGETSTHKVQQLTNIINTKTKELETKSANITQLTTEVTTGNEARMKLEQQLEAAEKETTLLKEEASEKKKHVELILKDLDAKASSISHLMSEVKCCTDTRAKLESQLQTTRKEMEIAKEEAAERERALTKKVEQLDALTKSNEKEMTNHLNIIMDLRNDKARLENENASLQNKMSNIQKELIVSPRRPHPPPASRAREPPEHDDNACMLSPKARTPQHKKPLLPSSRPQIFSGTQKPSSQLDLSLDFDFMSESSLDEDGSLDTAEINRRFEALSRGERLPPVPLSALKRRRKGVAAASQPQRHRPNTDGNDDGTALSRQNGHKTPKERMFFKTKRQSQEISKK